MTYNFTAVTDSYNILQLVAGVNTASGNFLVYGMLVAAWVVLFMVMRRYNDPGESVFASSVAVSITAGLFMAANLVTVTWFVVFVVMAAISGVALYVRR